MNVDRFIASMTTDTRTRNILKRAARTDDTVGSRAVMKAFLSSEITALLKVRAPRLVGAARAFVTVPEPYSIHRALQLYMWLNEKIPEGHDRETLIVLAMTAYLEKEAKASVARDMVDFMAARS